MTLSAIESALAVAVAAEPRRRALVAEESERIRACPPSHPLFGGAGEARSWDLEGTVVRKRLRVSVSPTQGRLRAIASAHPRINPTSYDPVDHALVSPFVEGPRGGVQEAEAVAAAVPWFVDDVKPCNVIVGNAGPLLVDLYVIPGRWVRAMHPDLFAIAAELFAGPRASPEVVVPARTGTRWKDRRVRASTADVADLGWISVDGLTIRDPWDAVAALALATSETPTGAR